MPLPLESLKAQQILLYPPNAVYGWVALLDTTIKSFGFTTIAQSGYLTVEGHDYPAGTRLKFSSTGTLPAPLVAGTYYYTNGVDPVSPPFMVVSPTPALDSTILFTTEGTGTHTVEDVKLDSTISNPDSWIYKEIDYQGTATRKSYTPLEPIIDAVNNRVYTPEVSLPFVNDGAASMVFDAVVMLKGDFPTPGVAGGMVDLFTIFSSPQTIAPGETRVVKIPNIYANG